MATQMYNTLFNHPFFATRFNIPESFGRALSYEAQIHCILCLIDEMAGAAWVSPDEFDDEVSAINKEIGSLHAKDAALDAKDAALDAKDADLAETDKSNLMATNDALDAIRSDIETLKSQAKSAEEAYRSLNDSVGMLRTEIGKLGDAVNSNAHLVYGATVSTDGYGKMTLPEGTRIPIASINWWPYNRNPSNSTYLASMRSRDVQADDVKGDMIVS